MSSESSVPVYSFSITSCTGCNIEGTCSPNTADSGTSISVPDSAGATYQCVNGSFSGGHACIGTFRAYFGTQELEYSCN